MTTATAFNTKHTRDEHTSLGDPNTWSQADRIASRDTCAGCRIIFRDNGEFRAADRSDWEFGGKSICNTPAPMPRSIMKASQKQIDLMTRLLDEKDLSNTSLADWNIGMLAELPMKKASEGIDVMFAAPRKAAPVRTASSDAVTEDGMYQNPETKVVYKVQRSQAGHLYAKELFPEDGVFEYAAGAIRTLKASYKMTLAEAKAYGAVYGVCCNCGRTLTNEESIEAGIGPICAGKF